MGSNRRLIIALRVLLVMIVTLMALGAGVRTMNAGLSCPDWPLCFGKVIPDYHPGVWFEFVHRAYAGLVALLFGGIFVAVMRSKALPSAARKAAFAGLAFLTLQIVMGGLTVLLLVKEVVVTSHLMLATLFFACVLWIHEVVAPRESHLPARAPKSIATVGAVLSVLVLLQIMVGGFVASTYAGSVCVDWPLCNGKWIPTWKGAIGLQIFHRFFAYFLAVAIPAFSWVILRAASSSWRTPRLTMLAWWNIALIIGQIVVGVMNLLFYIPAWLTVIHQSMAVIIFATNLRAYLEARALARASAETAKNPAMARGQFAGGVSG